MASLYMRHFRFGVAQQEQRSGGVVELGTECGEFRRECTYKTAVRDS